MPKKLIKIFLLLSFTLWSLTWSFSVGAQICQECHSQKLLRQSLMGSLEEFAYAHQSVYQAKLNPCPGVRSLAEELFLTESRLQKYASLLITANKGEVKAQELSEKIHQIGAELEILKKERIEFPPELTKSMATLRLSLQKVYAQIWQLRTEREKRWLMGVGSLIILAFFFLSLVAWKKLNNIGKNSVIIFLLAVNLGLANCSGKLEEKPKAKAQEQLEQALLMAQKRGKEVEDAYQKIMLLTSLAKEFPPGDSSAAKKLWELARAMATSVNKQNKEFISQLEIIRSALPPEKINPESLRELQAKTDQLQGSIFLERLLAEEWMGVDHKEGRQFLKIVTNEILSLPPGEIRDRELKALAEIWGDMEREEALKLISQIKDPYLRAMSLGRLALFPGDKEVALGLCQKAAQEASLVSPPWRQVQALIRLSAWAARIKQEEGENYAELTQKQIEALPHQQLQSWAWQEMIKNWAPLNSQKAERWLNKIPASFAESRVYSLLHLARPQDFPRKLQYLRQALAEAQGITDEFERRKLSSLVLEDILLLDQREAVKNLQELKDPYILAHMLPKIWRAMASTDKGRGLKMAQNMAEEESRYLLILELLKDLLPKQREELLNLYREVFQLAKYISEPYQRWLILRELSEKWGRLDSKGRAACLKEGEVIVPQIPSGQKAEILAYLAASWKSWDEKKSKSFLEKLPRELYLSSKILEEVRAWGKVDLQQAKELVRTLPAEFPLEKIKGYQEIARLLKKENPQEAWKYLDLAWQEAKKVSPNLKIMRELVKEGATVNKHGIEDLISQIPMRQERDLLLQELAKALIKTGQISDLAMAWQISKEISDISLILDLYEKIGMLIKTKKMEQALAKSPLGELGALQNWPEDKEKAEEMVLKIKDQKLKARLLAFLATNLAQRDEEEALRIAEKISGFDQDAYTFALYKIGCQFRKWNRAKGREVLERALLAAEKMKETDLRIERIHQLAKEIYYLDKNFAQSILQKLAADFPLAQKDFLLTLVEWNPHLVRKIASEAKNPFAQAQIYLRGAEILTAQGWGESNKLLEAAAQWAKKINHPRGQGEVAEIWILGGEEKGWEIWKQIGSAEERVKILIRLGQRKDFIPPEEFKNILERARAETFKIDEANKRIKFLMEIARLWQRRDEQKRREILAQAYQIVINSPEFLPLPGRTG